MAVDVTTKYLGLSLRNPLIVSPCPLTREIHHIDLLEQAGAAAIVLYSLFAEQAASDELHAMASTSPSTDSTIEANPVASKYAADLDAYLRNLELAKKTASIPIIGSLNASGIGQWVRFASLIEQAGADALELNIYFVPTDPRMTSGEVESRYIEVVATVRELVSIPLAVKIGPFISSLPNFAARLVEAGADGIVLFNRFLQPDIDIDSFAVEPRLILSCSDEVRLPLRWVAILRSQLKASLAATSGVHAPEDLIKLLLAGADGVMIASVLLKEGPKIISELLAGLESYLQDKNFVSIDAMRGMVSQHRSSDPDAFERANYVKSLVDFEMDA
ncbi:MAG: dihydroorotate dehydrogenase-like protein [Planctomycetales bacterium]|nr:dihydroorotate dehydrogenase-like protein [Planctomycetales bacterium]